MSAYVLVGLPFLIALAVTLLNPVYMSPLWHTRTGHELIAVGVTMLMMGSAILRRSSRSGGSQMLLLIAALSLAFAAFSSQRCNGAAASPARALKARGGLWASARQHGSEILRFRERVLAPTVRRLASMTLRLNPKASADAIASRLIASGVSAHINTNSFSR